MKGGQVVRPVKVHRGIRAFAPLSFSHKSEKYLGNYSIVNIRPPLNGPENGEEPLSSFLPDFSDGASPDFDCVVVCILLA